MHEQRSYQSAIIFFSLDHQASNKLSPLTLDSCKKLTCGKYRDGVWLKVGNRPLGLTMCINNVQVCSEQLKCLPTCQFSRFCCAV